MLDWRGASPYELKLLSVFKKLFVNHDKLLAYLFERDAPQLKKLPEELLSEMGVFSSGEKILIRVALDLWDGSGKAYFWDIFHRLDGETILVLLQSLEFLEIITHKKADGSAPMKNGMVILTPA